LNTHEIEDTKTLIRNCKSKDSHYNGQQQKEKNIKKAENENSDNKMAFLK
jgi:hypothetical protein